MIDGKFDVVFRGQIIKSMELTEVKVNLANLFKSSPEAIEKLFSGEEAVIKKSLDYAMAMKYQSAIKKSGALALIKEIEEPIAKIQAKPNSGRASFGVTEPSDEVTEANADVNAEQNTDIQSHQTPVVTSENNPPTETKEAGLSSEGNDMTLADAGSQILPDKVYEKREVDTSELSLALVGERLLPKKAAEVHVQPSIDHLSLE